MFSHQICIKLYETNICIFVKHYIYNTKAEMIFLNKKQKFASCLLVSRHPPSICKTQTPFILCLISLHSHWHLSNLSTPALHHPHCHHFCHPLFPSRLHKVSLLASLYSAPPPMQLKFPLHHLSYFTNLLISKHANVFYQYEP